MRAPGRHQPRAKGSQSPGPADLFLYDLAGRALARPAPARDISAGQAATFTCHD